MRIAIINDLLGSGSNGTFVVTYNLIQHLKEQGHDVRVICPDPAKAGKEGYYVMPHLSLGEFLDKYIAKVGVTLCKCSHKTIGEALEGVEYIHCITPFKLSIYAADYAVEHNIPISAGFHAMAENITSYLRLNRLKALNKHIYKHLYKKLYSKVDGVHFPTTFMKDFFEKAIGGRHVQSYVISNGANKQFERKPCEKSTELQGKIVITSTGRYSLEKSQETLLKAIAYSKYKDDIQVVLAGHGARENYYKRLGKKLPNPPIMKVFSREDMAQLLNMSDLYVHPAIIELEGIACLEAMKCGVPMIVSDSPLSATQSFAPDKQCVFESGNYKKLALAIDALLDDPKKRAELSDIEANSGVKYVDECMAEMDEMIADIVRRKREKANA